MSALCDGLNGEEGVEEDLHPLLSLLYEGLLSVSKGLLTRELWHTPSSTLRQLLPDRRADIPNA